METNKPITVSEFKEFYSGKFSKANLSDQRLYKQMCYDKYRDIYYRIIANPLEAGGNDYELLIFNSALDIIGKLLLGKNYIPSLIIMTDGIYIRKLDQRESYIDLVKLEFDLD